MPHSLDFRGRAYPIPPHLNHIGDDLSRSLLVFSEGKTLGERGLRWLKIHAANLYGYDKANFEERVQWVEDHLDAIKESATNPLEVSISPPTIYSISQTAIVGNPMVDKSRRPMAIPRYVYGTEQGDGDGRSHQVYLLPARTPGRYLQRPAALCCAWRRYQGRAAGQPPCFRPAVGRVYPHQHECGEGAGEGSGEWE